MHYWKKPANIDCDKCCNGFEKCTIKIDNNQQDSVWYSSISMWSCPNGYYFRLCFVYRIIEDMEGKKWD